MEVQQLKYFISVIESGSLSRAAASLHMSQSALSQQMRALERSLNATLLERSTRGVRPTTAGESLYRDAFRLVREFDHLATSVSAETDIRGVVSVGLPSGAATQLAAPLVTWVLEHYPGIRLELIDAMSGYIRELFDNGRIDVAVSYESPSDGPDGVESSHENLPPRQRAVGYASNSRQDVSTYPLYEEEMFAFGDICSAHARSGRVSLDDLATLPLVVPGLRSSLRSQIESSFRIRGLSPTIAADLGSLPAMLEIARRGSAYAILPLSADREKLVPRYTIEEASLRRRAVLKVSKTRSTSPGALEAVVQGIRSTVSIIIEQSSSTGFLTTSS